MRFVEVERKQLSQKQAQELSIQYQNRAAEQHSGVQDKGFVPTKPIGASKYSNIIDVAR